MPSFHLPRFFIPRSFFPTQTTGPEKRQYVLPIPDWEATAMETETGPYQGPAHSQMSPVLQTPAMLDRDRAGELWRIPLKPIILKTRTMVRERHNVSEPSTLDYHVYCSKIVRAWHVVDPKAWLPEHIRKDTPYSLALLSQLARLASRTRATHIGLAGSPDSRNEPAYYWTHGDETVLPANLKRVPEG